MSRNWEQVIVGIGVILINKEGKVLIGKRKANHANKYSIFGGALEMGETFEECAIREAKEETNLDIRNPKVIAITNNLETYKEDNVHTISIILVATEFTGELQNKEPCKCEGWFWCDPHELPTPHFDASRMAIDCYLHKQFYIEAE